MLRRGYSGEVDKDCVEDIVKEYCEEVAMDCGGEVIRDYG